MKNNQKQVRECAYELLNNKIEKINLAKRIERKVK